MKAFLVIVEKFLSITWVSSGAYLRESIPRSKTAGSLHSAAILTNNAILFLLNI
jgi:hypothetical protein